MKRLAILFLLIIVLAQTAVPSTRIFASDEGLILTLETNETEVKSGEEFSYMINYSASSAANSYTDPRITFLLPAGVTYTGKTDSAITTSTVTDSVGFPGRKEVTFQFKNGELPAGSTGQLVVKGKFENYTTPDGTTTTAKAQFHAAVDGTPVSMDSNSVTVTAHASASWDIQMRKVAPVVEPFKDSNVEYEINVQPTSNGYGLLDIQNVTLTAQLADDAVFFSATNGGTLGPGNTVVWNLPDGIRGLKSVRVTVYYPDSITVTEVTSEASLTYTPIGQASTSVSASTTHGFETLPIDRGTALTVSNKNGVKQISPGQAVTFTLSDLSNNANISLDYGVLELMTPTQSESGTPIQFHLQSIKLATFSGISTYDLYYTEEKTPTAGDWMLWSNLSASTARTLNLADLYSIKGVQGIQVRFNTLPINWKQLSDFELTYKHDSSTSLPVDLREIIELLAEFRYPFNGRTITSTGSSQIILSSPKASIGDFVWLDTNENGLQDTGESGINGVRVELYDGTFNLLATTTTATFNGLPGHYEMNNLTPGNYQVRFVLPTGYKFTQKGAGSSVEPSTGRTAVVALAPGEENVGIDAGLIHLALPLNIQFEANGNASPAKTAASKVTLTDTESGVDAASLEYIWTRSTTVPTGGWTAFASGDTLTHTGEDGSWYLHIRAIDRIGNPAYAVSNAFVLQAPATTDTANNRVSASPSTVTTGDTITLTATGDRQLVAGVVIGDERYIPTSWSSTESGKSGTFILDSGNYYTTYMPSTAGSYTVTVTFKKQIWGGDDWEDAGEDTKTVAVTVNSVPTYSIAAIQDRTLSELKQGYASGQQETATIDVINTGTGELENVTTTLSGANANDFVLTPPSDTIGSGSASSLTITAKDGLAAGTYVATVTVSADHMTSVTFTVTQVVKPASSPPPNGMYVQHVEDLVDITGLPNGTAKTATALGLPSQIEVTLSDGSTTQTEVSWNVAEASYDPASTDQQTFTVTGNLVNLPSGITNPQNLTVSIQITVEATNTETKDIIRVHTPSAITGLPNGTKKTAVALRLPKQVEATLSDDSTIQVAVKWDVDGSDYEPGDTEAQTFTVNGTLVKLPNGVTNSQDLTTSIQVSVKAADAVENPKDIVSVSKPAAIKGVENGTAKKASALGLPKEIQVILDDDTKITIPIKWDVAGSEYDPTNEDKQTFTVTGWLIKLPDDVTNSQNLTVSIRVTVDAAKRRDREGGKSGSSGSGSSDNKGNEVILDKKNVKENLQKALGNNQDVVRFIIDDLLKNPADEILVKVPKNSLDLIKEQQVSLQIQIGDVTITIPREMIAALWQDELYFHVVPVKKRTEQQAIVERILQAEEVQKAAGGQDVQVVSKPIVIETNYKNKRTKVMFSLKDVKLPTDPQSQKAFLASLAIFVEHTDGEKALKNGKIHYDKDGKPVGIEIEITKFSTFTILSLKAKQEQVEHMPYMSGYPDQTFKPSHEVTRAEMAAILAHFLKEEQPTEAEFPADISLVSTSPFGDVPATHWAASAIQLVQSAGLMAGNGNGLFQPNAKITRAEMAAIITNWNQLSANGKAAHFTDTNGHWAEASIVAVVEAGVMNGYENGSFRPNQGLTRAEAVTLFNRLTGRGPLTGIAQTSWSDVPVTHWAFTEIMEAAVPHVALKRADGAEVVTKEQTN